MRAFTVMLGAIAKAMGGDVPQGADSLASGNLSGRGDRGAPWNLLISIAGGSGGRPFADGTDAAHPTHGRNLPAEYAEALRPVEVLELRLLPDTGGAGKFRGGRSTQVVYRLKSPARLTLRTDRRYLQPIGVKGGYPGTEVRLSLISGGVERQLPGKASNLLAERDDLLIVTSPGGGGWGDPLDRSPELVEGDLADGAITARAAREAYGVVAGEPEATRALRESLKAGRQRPRPLFDRGPLFAERAARGELQLTVSDE
jgi:N-methylhydantoinase B